MHLVKRIPDKSGALVEAFLKHVLFQWDQDHASVPFTDVAKGDAVEKRVVGIFGDQTMGFRGRVPRNISVNGHLGVFEEPKEIHLIIGARSTEIRSTRVEALERSVTRNGRRTFCDAENTFIGTCDGCTEVIH